ncbi:hypothetical protein MAC_08096 [Metarhizium acridum CQMa 102]|uniref:Protein kinase domain-containing protein n=1 Tax=Metarhizium acridum (strain CQMa 102) TaxID=655827 RepID=E9EDZ8_METAQ|nr:uncharacterized protein MAC_08096 [Metarhizium acridum CQMa 102]EFY85837.1 hypothetical protein MAC_08096 [Metarhizium acridum CQMa 102]
MRRTSDSLRLKSARRTRARESLRFCPFYGIRLSSTTPWAELILAVAYLHGKGFVHGDLHLGNVLLRLPQEFHLWSDEELLARCGDPEQEPVQAFDDRPIPRV